MSLTALRDWITGAALLCALAAVAPAQAADSPDRSQYVFLAHLDGNHVGSWKVEESEAYYSETLRVIARQDNGRTAVVESFRMTQGAAGWTWERRVRAGTVERNEHGTLAGGRLMREEKGGSPVLLASVPRDAVLPSTRAQRIRAFAAQGASRSPAFAYVDPSRLQVVQARLEACALDVGLAGAGRCVALRLEAGSGDEQWHLSPDGRVLRIDAGFGGLPLRLDACARKCDQPVVRPFDMIGTLMVASPHRISKKVAYSKLRYVLVRDDGQPPVLARTSEQSVAMAGSRAVVTVCRDCGSPSAETPESLAPYLRANAWVRSDDVTVRRVARGADAPDGTLAVRMKKLERQVTARMRNDADYLGYGDAVKALRTGRGDCTEFAVLLAALARAQGIPARVAVGMAYSARFTGRKDTFAPHVWVQVYDGQRWVSYDAALEGFDSTHVALAISTGEPQEVFDAFLQLRQLRIERMGSVVR